jgi:murein DD-endopeptidase MepM/ murein hydrolase activator NlpD
VVLNVNMSVSDVLQERMDSEQQEHFDILMESLGLQQFVRSPFENNWLGAVTSVYGYRLHPITRTREMHTGIDIAMPEGTPIMGGLEGATVITAQDMGGYGLTVVIEFVDAETEQGVRVLYAHMASIAVNVGDVVNVGDILGAVGQTGTATGAHLHLEIFITEDGGATWRRVNPLFHTDPFVS